MAEGTYEFECMRAELLGNAKPNQEEFEKARAERLKKELEEKEQAEAEMLEQQEDSMKNTGGRLDELNSILSSTQQKLNRFKQTACGSLSNIFSKGSVDSAEGPSTSSHSSRRNTTACAGNANENGKIILPKDSPDDKLDEALKALEEDKQNPDDIQPAIPIEKIRAAKADVSKKMSSHLDKLDVLINKAERAEISMTEQTKQMKKMTK